ncbi:hypothetical protein EMIHUDRAFT_223735 [Emiliania huxleyi CCMP1516]|uniref:Uncharacterized protein n=2 Tax=Emiliania huxleyi TaxID=2903 RepID=A0A0D3KU00_EMIH1|nr:hypothetical protein EMIHUDRAFT_213584 [Emiliania huxleyi CCMP1516]XP_005791664.1 hypothetical protein EMIHUDRAFT_223735 [Emiliania huxleyi CCMP1516]EOD12368.1 hypothetical protein EMIHUDRAFT_213584 [Emiliania huxleyi CCMP1516]EOD39235.1 hypothetical protein EMIHUDRAFT_223735 [Emiliania huxleyi CCMP1516]|eukprot:XP_005764797.1 hypothetical protein EMIHUDRAFT_213584 [Emiliania huxleyi CCMP1516]
MSLRYSVRRGNPGDEARVGDADADEGASSSGWKAEIESITNGTHPALVAELASHKATMQQQITQAEALKNAQTKNVLALFECDKKQVDDEYKAQLEFFQSRLIDSLEQKQRAMARQVGFKHGRRPADPAKGDAKGGEGDAKRAKNVDHYTVRSAAMASGDAHGGNEVWYDRSRLQLHCHGHSFERNGAVLVYQHGQRLEDEWTISAMNAVETTLRARGACEASDGAKLKVTLSQLRSGRYSLKPPMVPSGSLGLGSRGPALEKGGGRGASALA